ncbi:MAG TPA: alcohol dehydrogenase catalytic domain-containing protein [Candidatus Thermoplasmatota archaeon]|nr:alcohol dehydrogenase catalytic domain-containing protein [Candidatus Thermoplasmatota archaeon]
MAETTMKAAVIAAPGKLEVQRVPVPRPGPGQVRIRVEGCGVCGSDMALFEGRPWFEYPREPGAPGHEGFGVIDALGPGVTGWRVGDRVTGLFGRYAEYDVAPAEHLIAMPEGVPTFLGEPLACAVNAFRRSDVRAGQTVAVVGTGFLGALLVGLASEAGATVIGVSRRGASLKAAESMGAKHLVEMDEPWKVVQEVERITGGALCDRVLEVTGKEKPLDLAGKLTKVRGRLVIAGYHQEHRNVDMQLWNWRGLDVVNAHERDPMVYLDGMREAARLVASGRLRVDGLLTHTFPLDDAQRAFETMRDRPDGFLKAVVRP